MATSYDSNDAAWSWSGDFLLSDTSDLADTSSDSLQSLVDQISVVTSSSINDWFVYPGRGATLDDFVGEPNSRDTGDNIHDRIRLSIVSAGLVAEEDLYIRIVPVQLHKILVMIYIDAVASSTNRIGQGGPLQISLAYDTIQQGVFFFAANFTNSQG